MSDWKSVSGFITSAPLDLTFFGKSNRAIVRISPDGKVEYGPDYTPDAAAKAFWEAVNHHGPYAENTRLREENARLREETDGGKADDCKSCGCQYESWKANYQRLTIQNDALREENARLREALKPFADRLDELEKMKASKYACATSVEIEHLRAAATAIREGGEGD